MSINSPGVNKGYGLQNALQDIFPQPIVSRRNPTGNDRAPLGATWVNSATNEVYCATSTANGQTIWTSQTGAGGLTFHTDAGNALPIGNVINIVGAANQLNTVGAANTITAHLDDAVIVVTSIEAPIFINDGIAVGFAGSQTVESQAGLQTVDGNPHTIFQIVVPVQNMLTIDFMINGFRSDFAEAFSSKGIASFLRGAGNIALTGGPQGAQISNSAPAVGMATNADTVGQNAQINVTGQAGQTWNWVISFKYMFTHTNA